MKEFKTFDELAVFIINNFAEIFGNHAILKGGIPHHTLVNYFQVSRSFRAFSEKYSKCDVAECEIQSSGTPLVFPVVS